MEEQASSFIWDRDRESVNIQKHGVDFVTAAQAFKNPGRKIFIDNRHSQKEERYFCIGKADNRIITVRFIYREGKVRIFGAGYWRKGVKYYEQED